MGNPLVELGRRIMDGFGERLGAPTTRDRGVSPRLAGGEDGAPASVDAESGLDILVKKGMISRQADGYICSPDIETVAERFLVINNRVTLQAACVDDFSSAMTTHIEMLRFGLSELLLIEKKGPSELHMCAISPDVALAVIADLLSNPGALKEMETVEEISSPGKTPCSGCGEALADDARFCPACGIKVERPDDPRKQFCSACGKKLEPADKFCVHCGVRI